MDYYFAPVVDKRIHGWHAELGGWLPALRQCRFSVHAGRMNRVDPFWFAYAENRYSNASPVEVLLTNIPEVYAYVTVSWSN